MRNNLETVIRTLAPNQFFSCTFVKRTTGEVREMNCRLGVKPKSEGKGMKYNPSQRGLLTVYDVKKKNYRMINLDTIVNLKINGKEFRF